jgi:pimeloyl-ACP methyl ester carboxylesterase
VNDQELYRDVPPAQGKRLFTFRASHPYRQITVADGTWRYLACGCGDRALLLLPGAFLRADMWFNQVLALEDHYRIIAPDAYALQGLFDLDLVCDALLRSLDAEEIESATVIGISAGGGVAQALLQTHPGRVEHAVFSHCGVLDRSADRDRQTRHLLGLVRVLPLPLIRHVLKRMTSGETPPSSRWAAFHDAYLREAIPTIERGMFAGFLRSGLEARRHFTFDPRALDAWPGRVLILSSEDDALSRPGVEALRARYPRTQVELLPQGGHHAFLFFPEVYTAALRRFLDAAP